VSEDVPIRCELTLLAPTELLEPLARLVASRVAERLPPPRPESPWLDFEGAREYLRFSRDQLYKLTAAKAIPFRKKRGGQALLFHRYELDRWVGAAYESTGCAGEVELRSSTNQ
jgi:predicted DNA-binding transcriptional regulator AlpA